MVERRGVLPHVLMSDLQGCYGRTKGSQSGLDAAQDRRGLVGKHQGRVLCDLGADEDAGTVSMEGERWGD